ncbi:hypothetical protein Goklo_011496, partial [Gossypium klotzschianum]|nr:hypothetical protein [Gossypium klotzschianum]
MLTIGSIVVLGPGKAKCLHQEPLCRSQLKNTTLCLPNISKQNNGQLFQRNQTFPSLINGGCRNKKMKYNLAFCFSSYLHMLMLAVLIASLDFEKIQEKYASDQLQQLWALGTLVPLLLSFTTSKWGPFLKLKNEADNMLEAAEQITDVVEDDLAEETAKNAHLAGDLIDK